jgi:hypothetical protein
MTELAETKQRYHLRLLERYVIYDPDHGQFEWREWPEGAIVTDSDTIKLLTARGAPVEIIEPLEGKTQ